MDRLVLGEQSGIAQWWSDLLEVDQAGSSRSVLYAIGQWANGTLKLLRTSDGGWCPDIAITVNDRASGTNSWTRYSELYVVNPHPKSHGHIAHEHMASHEADWDSPDVTPLDGNPPGATIGVRAASGKYNRPSKDASVAYDLANTGARFRAGLNFNWNALVPDFRGLRRALQMAQSTVLQFFTNSGGLGPDIGSDVDQAGRGLAIRFWNGGIALQAVYDQPGARVNVFRFDEDGTLRIMDRRVVIGAPDSAGPGLRTLAIEN